MPCRERVDPWEVDLGLWERCREQVAKQMLAQGWTPRARKFNDVRRRRALRLFFESCR